MTDWNALFPVGHAFPERMAALAAAAAAHLPGYGLTTPLRIAHFMGQAAHETGGFVDMHEIWGPTVAQRGYETRRDLGNCQPGDGLRFRGRGLFQITGRDQYARLSKRLDVDLIGNPELAETPEIAVRTAGDYWATHGLGALADADNGKAITLRINGGLNGYADRINRTNAFKRALGILAEKVA